MSTPQMKTKGIVRLLGVAACVLVAATTAFAEAEEEILGKWAGDGSKIEFKEDGTFAEEVRGDKVTGKYSVPDETHLKQEFDGPMSAVGPVTSVISVDGDTLEMTPDGGSKTTMKRVKAE